MITKSIVQDKRYLSKKQGGFPVKLCLPGQQYCPLNIYLSADDYARLSQPRLPQRLQEVKDRITGYEAYAAEILNTLAVYNFATFKAIFSHHVTTGSRIALEDYIERKRPQAVVIQLNPQPDIKQIIQQRQEPEEITLPLVPAAPVSGEEHLLPAVPQWNLQSLFLEVIEEYKRRGRAGTAKIYRTGLTNLLWFKPDVQFWDITPDFPREFQTWMQTRRKSLATTGCNLRQIRSVYNQALRRNIIPRPAVHPFDKRLYVIPRTRRKKQALSLADIRALKAYQPANKKEAFALDFWFISFYFNGLNLKDMAVMKYHQIKGNFIIVERREKTKFTTKKQVAPIKIFLSPALRELIERHSQPKVNEDTYLFPILREGCSEAQIKNLVRNLSNVLNRWLLRIGKKLGFSLVLNMLMARYAYCTTAKKKGATVSFIQEMVGHSNPMTTLGYLDDFEDEQKEVFAMELAAAI